jgi:hypothetical protein
MDITLGQNIITPLKNFEVAKVIYKLLFLSNWAKLIISILFGEFIKKSNITSLKSAIYAFFDKAKIDINNSLRLLMYFNIFLA